ncbi:hypothetical protein KEM56_000313 [Ascosphaera pollenicola]|nr:hypothetical protein KEM56_000313 [Ascosphaera pollenicola]
MGAMGNRKKKIALWVILVVAVALNIGAIGILVGACIPTAKMWNPKISGKCVKNLADVTLVIGMLQASFSAATDVALAIFPTFIIHDLKMPLKFKLGLCVVMALGNLAGIATIIKVILFKSLLPLEMTDITYAWAPITIAYTTLGILGTDLLQV